jgi:acyl-homoserine-lactone acylase
VRTDWVHNSNDSFFYTHPASEVEPASRPWWATPPDPAPHPRRPAEIPKCWPRQGHAAGHAGAAVQNRNFMASVIVPDLLAACAKAPQRRSARRLRGPAWLGPRNNLDARGAHLFREFWRNARNIPGVYRVPFDVRSPWPHRPA